MRILTIVGKVDTRVISYPIARALSLSGLTAMITDDGAYRRLYHGEELNGTVSGIDISVGLKAEDELLNSLNNSGVPYDNIVYVSSGHIPSVSNGVIVCHGVDRSIMGISKAEKELLEQRELEAERAKMVELQKKKAKNKKDTAEETQSDSSEEAIDTNKEIEVKEVKEVKDEIAIPEGMDSFELQISYSSPNMKGLTAILLKDSFMNYIYSCEEKKEIAVYPDKNFNKILANILDKTLKIKPDEALKLLERNEYQAGKNK